MALIGSLLRVAAQDTGNTVGLTFFSTNCSPGYTLYSPINSTHTYLINNRGELVHRWTSNYTPGASTYLLKNGDLFRTAKYSTFTTFNGAGAEGGRVEEYDWDGHLLWSYNYESAVHRQHHDAIVLPNGDVLMIAHEVKTGAEALVAGRNPSLLSQTNLWAGELIEVQPSGTNGGSIVWEWHSWDHLIQDYDATKANYGVVADHPELINLNEGGDQDWLHMNGLDYNPDTDQVLISVHHMNEIWVVDHSTTSAEASGHTGGRYGKGGDLLYRWGNPVNYDRGTSADQKLFGQHNAHWIPQGLPGAGHILVFNNGGYGRANYSSVDEFIPPVDTNGVYYLAPGTAYGPSGLVWTYVANPATNFFSQYIGGCQRLAKGNTFICSGMSGRFFEVTDSGETVWNYICPTDGSGDLVTQGDPPANGRYVFRSPHYAPDYAGLAGRDLSPEGTVELPADQTLRLTTITNNGLETKFSWVSLPDRDYKVWYKQRLTDANWTNVGTVTSIGTLTTFSDTDALRRNGPMGFYRIELQP